MPLAFEGSEKKVEILFKANSVALWRDLNVWTRVVAHANATILSTIRNDKVIAYLLSESSLFVYEDRLVMITCGTTTLINAVTETLAEFGAENVDLLMYERKNELFPQHQPANFEQDVLLLRRLLPEGEAFRFGQDRGNFVSLFYYASETFRAHPEDMTLEILMHDISQHARSYFIGTTAERVHRETAIQSIFPNFQSDDFVFDPMGYSLNAIGDDEYYTFHVTPEDDCSYASFETNHSFDGDLPRTVAKVLAIFQPRSFALVLFNVGGKRLELPPGYRIQSRQDRRCCGYHIQFANLERID